jgi:acetyltransferase
MTTLTKNLDPIHDIIQPKWLPDPRRLLPRPGVQPYPFQYVTPWRLKDGTIATIRPIRPDDEPLMARFHETLSEHSVYLRYLHVMKLSQRVAHERLARLCLIDYAREMALIAEYEDPQSGQNAIIAVGRLVRLKGADEAEFALVVCDRYQGSGLGTELLRRLVQIGREENLKRIVGYILPENDSMQHICQKLGFRLRHSLPEHLVIAEIAL